MRQNRIIITKDHLIYVAACNEVGDELWAGDIENNAIKTTNTIGIIFNGTANSFYKNEQGVWNPYISGGNLMGLVRRNFSDFGFVSTSNSVSFGAVIAREHSFVAGNEGTYKMSEISTENEKEKIQTGTETIYMNLKCKAYQKRDLNSFDEIPIEQIDINMISDSEIEMIIEED